MDKELQQAIEKRVAQGIEYREMVLTITNTEEKDYRVEGYATTYNQPYVLFKYEDDGVEVEVQEQVDAKAFDNAEMDDVIMQYNHEGRVFARIRNNTLALDKEDPKGLKVTADLGGTQIGRGLYEEIAGGYTDSMSIGFTVTNDTIDEVEATDQKRTYLRTINSIGRLYDVSAVSIPANYFTELSAVAVRGKVQAIEAEALAQAVKAKEAEARANRVNELSERLTALKADIKALKGE